MALSNIFQEPRREITESAVGIVAAAAVLPAMGYASTFIAAAIQSADPKFPFVIAMFLGFLGVFVAVLLGGLFVGVTHWIGEEICDALQNRGVHLRPRARAAKGR